jgi:hypothetical protein
VGDGSITGKKEASVRYRISIFPKVWTETKTSPPNHIMTVRSLIKVPSVSDWSVNGQVKHPRTRYIPGVVCDLDIGNKSHRSSRIICVRNWPSVEVR